MVNVNFLIGEQTRARGFERNNSTIGPIDTSNSRPMEIPISQITGTSDPDFVGSSYTDEHGQIRKSSPPPTLIRDNCKRAINRRGVNINPSSGKI